MSTRADRHAGSSAKRASHGGDQQREPDRVPVERDRVARQTTAPVRTSAAKDGERNAGDGRRDGQHGGLDKHLPDKAAAIGAERPTYGHLARTALAANEQQIRDVCAGDEQQAAYGAEDQQQRRPHGCGCLIRG